MVATSSSAAPDAARGTATPADRADPSVAFVLALAAALHRYGTPAHRLEEAMVHVGRRLGLQTQFFSTPTTILASFGEPSDMRTALLRVDGGELDMGKLARLDEVADLVAVGAVTPEQGLRAIDLLIAAPPTWGKAVTTLAHGVTTAAVVVFFGGGLPDVAVAGLLGLLIGVLSLVMTRSTAQARVFELVAAAVAAFGGGVAAAAVDGVSSSVVTLAGLLVLLPGVALTVAMTELATHNLISGTARLVGAIVVLLALALGVAMGEAAAQALVDVPVTAPARLPAWSAWAAVVISAITMVVVVRAQGRAAPWIVVTTLCGYAGARLGTAALGPHLGVMVGAFALGVLVNVYARLLDRPAQVVLLPATLLLVPGSIGFRGISGLLHRNTLGGIESTFAMFVVAMAIVAGLLVANAAVPPRRIL